MIFLPLYICSRYIGIHSRTTCYVIMVYSYCFIEPDNEKSAAAMIIAAVVGGVFLCIVVAIGLLRKDTHPPEGNNSEGK